LIEKKQTRISPKILYNLESQFRSFSEDLGLICKREFTLDNKKISIGYYAFLCPAVADNDDFLLKHKR